MTAVNGLTVLLAIVLVLVALWAVEQRRQAGRDRESLQRSRSSARRYRAERDVLAIRLVAAESCAASVDRHPVSLRVVDGGES